MDESPITVSPDGVKFPWRVIGVLLCGAVISAASFFSGQVSRGRASASSPIESPPYDGQFWQQWQSGIEKRTDSVEQHIGLFEKEVRGFMGRAEDNQKEVRGTIGEVNHKLDRILFLRKDETP